MEKYKIIKNILITLIALIIALNPSKSKAQSTYQKYDSVTLGIEYKIAKAQIESNKKQIQLLEAQKRSLSLHTHSQTRSRIQGVVSAKNEENFRLNQKAFGLMDANNIENLSRYNNSYEQLRPKQVWR